MMEGQITPGMSKKTGCARLEPAERKYGFRTRVVIIVTLTLFLWLCLIGAVALLAY